LDGREQRSKHKTAGEALRSHSHGYTTKKVQYQLSSSQRNIHLPHSLSLPLPNQNASRVTSPSPSTTPGNMRVLQAAPARRSSNLNLKQGDPLPTFPQTPNQISNQLSSPSSLLPPPSRLPVPPPPSYRQIASLRTRREDMMKKMMIGLKKELATRRKLSSAHSQASYYSDLDGSRG